MHIAIAVAVVLALAVCLARLSTFLARPVSSPRDRRARRLRELAGGFACLLMLGVLLAPVAALGQYTPQTKTYTFTGVTTVPAQTFTAASQTGTAITLLGANSGTISLVGTSLTTATWQIQGSVDGTNYFALNVSAYNSCTVASCTVATSTTSTASALYRVNLSGLRYVKLLTTSGTFTGTSIALQLTYSDAKGTL
jgi:hypothetical protein